MPKRSWNLNTVYISERLQECLRPISRCALTTVVAPMGYGKTTAVNWYLLERAKLDEAAVVRISVYSDNLAIFWKSVQEAFSHAGLDFLRAYPCPDDAAGGSLLTDDLCHALAGKRPCYIFIDDFHLLTDNRVPAFLCTLTNRLPENVHLIVASRDRFLPAEEILRLGGRLYTVGAEQLRLNHTELSIYAHRCGTELSDAQIESLLYSSEGWFSAIYLNLRTLHERGELPSRSSDIYAMFSAAMIDPLPSKRREFLAVMGLADEFTVEMAETVTGSKNTAAILQTLTEQNAFVKRLPDGVTFRFHHMMKDCAERTFHTMEPRRQAVYHNRYGEWYKTHGQYLHALKFYCLAKNYDAALRVIQRDAGILLTSLGAQQVLDFIAHCPVETLKEHPLSLLVLMRSMFTWRQIPKMLELKELLLAAITVAFGAVIACLLAGMKLSKIAPLRWLSTAYIEIIRGTPMLLQLYFFYFALPALIPALNKQKFLCIAIALVCNSAAYVSEVIRSGIQSVDAGQSEAAMSLGMNSFQRTWYILVPQALKTILPALGNEFIMIVKDTSLASTFFIGDLMTQYLIVRGASYLPLEPLVIVGVIYFILTFLLSKLFGFFERRMSRADR